MSLNNASFNCYPMPERVLVTGARGFLGRHLLTALRALPVELLQHSSEDGDIARCELPFEGIDRVVHLAGRSFVPDSWVNPRAFYETNVLGAINVLEFCRKRSA